MAAENNKKRMKTRAIDNVYGDTHLCRYGFLREHLVSR